MLRLKTLKAKNCRGLIDGPELHFKNGGLLLCGSNGTGKSSFVDALEKVLTGKCSSLDTGDQGISWKEYGKHIGADDDPEIEITVAEGESVSVLNLTTDHSKLRKQVQSFLIAACQQSFILRRRALIDFINAKPKDRYEAVESFLNLHKFNAFEGRLKEMSDRVTAHLEAARNFKEATEEILRKELQIEAEPVNDKTCLSAINIFLARAAVSELPSISEAEAKLAEINAALVSYTNMEQLQKVQQLLTKVSEVPSSENIVKAATDYRDSRQIYVNERAKLKGQFYVEVLEKGLKWIKDDGLNQCPLCDSVIDKDAVARYVEGRLTERRELRELDEKQAEAHLKFKSTLLIHKDALTIIESQWEAVTGTKFPSLASQALTEIRSREVAHRQMLEPAVIDQDLQRFVGLELDTVTTELRRSLEVHKNILPDFQQYSMLIEARACLTVALAQLDTLKLHTAEVTRLSKAQPQIKKIMELASKARKNAVQQLLNRIATIADSYFQMIHPGEEIGLPSLEVKERGAGSIQLESHFHGKKGHPRGHYSEGHVDSLGLCMFLAIRRLHYNQNPSLSLLVLDDVMHSVDGDHRRATAEMIFNEFADHQIIITTHDPLWFENLKEAAGMSGRHFEQRRIADWTIKEGPVWGDHLSDYEWLVSTKARKAKVADKVQKAGRLLEDMLQNLCHGLGVEVPFNIIGLYSIDPLWSGFYRKAKKHPAFMAVNKSEIDKIEKLRKYRNWVGAHWNSWASQLTAAESNIFTDAVIKLRESTYCSNCRRFIERISQLDGVWSCKCEHIRFKK